MMDVVFRDLVVHIGNERILSGVSGMVKQGQLLAVMGPSGKSIRGGLGGGGGGLLCVFNRMCFGTREGFGRKLKWAKILLY